jgi:hypothetical protein
MTRIDVALSPDLLAQLDLPPCVDLRIPKPTLPQIRLPTGGSIKAIADITRGVPSDCSLNVNLALQLAPVMASIECLVKVLALMKPLIQVVSAVPNLPKMAEALPDFVKAAEDLAPCLLVPTPAVMIPFVKDILALVAAMLRCLIQQLRSLVELLAGLEVRIEEARAAGNADLLSTLLCAKENGETALASAMTGAEPIRVLLDLAAPFLGIAGVDAISLPPLAGAESLAAVEESLGSLQDVLDVLQAVTEALP